MKPLLTYSDESFGSVGVRFDRWDGEHAVYEWEIVPIDVTPTGPNPAFRGSDLRLGASDKASDAKALATLLGFLGAFAEAVDYSRHIREYVDNLELFPEALQDWASGVGEDFYLLEEYIDPEVES